MTSGENTEYVVRAKILNLLTDEETAKVSNLGSAANLIAGDEFLDLANIDQGVQQANTTGSRNADDIIPRGAVSAATWGKIKDAIGNR